jgi:NitT/TauT family transport system permease protein
VFRFSAWQKARWVELPSAALGLVWNSMMSMAGGWVFLSVIESFKLRDQDYRLPGLGSYLNEAWRQGQYGTMAAGMLAMVLMIVGLDQLLWRPVVVWAQKFRAEDDSTTPATTSWVLTALRRSRIVRWLRLWASRRAVRRDAESAERGAPAPAYRSADSASRRTDASSIVSTIALTALLVLLGYGAWRLLLLLTAVPAAEWTAIADAGALTLGRVTLATFLGTVWVLPVGLAIGLSPRPRSSIRSWSLRYWRSACRSAGAASSS